MKTGTPGTIVDGVVGLLERYQIQPTINSFDNFGLLLHDSGMRSVRCVEANYRGEDIHVPIYCGNSDVTIVFAGNLCLGWVGIHELDDLADRMSFSVKSLNTMPSTFDFKQTCGHLQVYGGISVDSKWECLGCGKELAHV